MKVDKFLPELAVKTAGMLSTFGPLSNESLEEFMFQYAELHEWALYDDYYQERLVPAMLKANLATKYKKGKMANLVKRDDKTDNKAGQDAFWFFLEHMAEAELDTIMAGPWPCQVTYLRRGNLYHILRCSGDGSTELGTLAANERAYREEKRSEIKCGPEEKFVLLFGSIEAMRKAPNVIKGPAIKAVIQYAAGDNVPEIVME